MSQCGIPDCPDRTGGRCFKVLGHELTEVVRELRAIRTVYDNFETDGLIDNMETPPRPYVTWRGWKLIRNVISDRIEEITESRV
jgi:hypothetical protein